MIYTLDLSKAQGTPFSVRVKKFQLPVKTGKYQKDFDLIECDIPRDIYAEIAQKITPINTSLPIGFDLSGLPVGAVLRRVK